MVGAFNRPHNKNAMFKLVVPEKVKNDLYNLTEDPYGSKIALKE